MKKFLSKLLTLFERAMLQSALLEEADFHMRYFQYWVKCEASDTYDAALNIEQDMDNFRTSICEKSKIFKIFKK